MIVNCKNCNKKFEIDDQLIPKKGRLVQCGFCGSKWHQLPQLETTRVDPIDKKKEYLIEAAKEIAAMKFQEYIIRKQLTDDSVSIKKSSFNKKKNETTINLCIVLLNFFPQTKNFLI